MLSTKTRSRPLTGWCHLLAALFLTAPCTRAEPGSETPLDQESHDSPLLVRLVSEVNAVQPGTPFQAGLDLRHGRGHHSYWVFPGIVGVPTRIEWDLPEGFEAGPLQWEVPERVDMRGIEAYGYSRDVLLTAEIRPPASLPEGNGIILRGRVSWMACSQERCNPGFLDLELRLRAASPDASAESVEDSYWKPRFAARRKREPEPLKDWNVAATRSQIGIELILTPAGESTRRQLASLRSLYFFNSNGLIASHKPHRYDIGVDSIRCILPVHPYAESSESMLRGVLVADPPFDPSQAAPQGVSIEVPIAPATEK